MKKVLFLIPLFIQVIFAFLFAFYFYHNGYQEGNKVGYAVGREVERGVQISGLRNELHELKENCDGYSILRIGENGEPSIICHQYENYILEVWLEDEDRFVLVPQPIYPQ